MLPSDHLPSRFPTNQLINLSYTLYPPITNQPTNQSPTQPKQSRLSFHSTCDTSKHPPIHRIFIIHLSIHTSFYPSQLCPTSSILSIYLSTLPSIHHIKSRAGIRSTISIKMLPWRSTSANLAVIQQVGLAELIYMEMAKVSRRPRSAPMSTTVQGSQTDTENGTTNSHT
ncbi:hypothetical protein Pcinc_043917 [Petrolisthes cinctipes]|uniref:Uncharacterized protein n=1 Tax=Petrolisthes cinctipes TaxID=88211 RepID=A0AAE1BGT6_PETCI|nr:hypothetical protein Pcinc_043917 [Petrolisthes cinctipes]